MTTTPEVLAAYVAAMAGDGSMEYNSEQDEAEFFDWLNRIRAQAYKRGVHEREEIPYWEDGPVNPYEEQA